MMHVHLVPNSHGQRVGLFMPCAVLEVNFSSTSCRYMLLLLLLLTLLFSLFSTTSVQTETSYEHFDHMTSSGKHNAPLGLGALEDDNVSEVSNLETELALSLQVQMAAMLSFAYIWSLGAFVPLIDK